MKLRLFHITVRLALAASFAFGPTTGTLAAPAVRSDAPPAAIFFAADGLRQDLVQDYAQQKLLPTLRELLKEGASAADGGLLTQAPPNTGAGWYSLATGAWAGVHGSTNNTFHRNGAPLSTRTGSFDAGVLQLSLIHI